MRLIHSAGYLTPFDPKLDKATLDVSKIISSSLIINDLPDEATDGVKSALYADDTKLYRNVSSTEHCHLIQMTLSNLHD